MSPLQSLGTAFLVSIAAIGINADYIGRADYPPPITAQSIYTESFTTEYYDDCATTTTATPYPTPAPDIILHETLTQTYCPDCHHSGYTIVYETAYEVFCPTGLSSKTYTITSTGSDSAPVATRPAGYIPEGFTVTVTRCTVCGPQPIIATLTVPCPTNTTILSTPVHPTLTYVTTPSAPLATNAAAVTAGPSGSSAGNDSTLSVTVVNTIARTLVVTSSVYSAPSTLPTTVSPTTPIETLTPFTGSAGIVSVGTVGLLMWVAGLLVVIL
ncbi:MAG: hypothetical protein M1829_000752 [Trizodia sp. TS-e1964]|nr:MAG: hypothetical protein M1829_000752 [Trizodia sp. TS-e1964]